MTGRIREYHCIVWWWYGVIFVLYDIHLGFLRNQLECMMMMTMRWGLSMIISMHGGGGTRYTQENYTTTVWSTFSCITILFFITLKKKHWMEIQQKYVFFGGIEGFWKTGKDICFLDSSLLSSLALWISKWDEWAHASHFKLKMKIEIHNNNFKYYSL